MDLKAPQLIVLEEAKLFAESMIWDLHKSYYQVSGIDAWRNGEVPFYITSNPVLAKAYAEIVFAFLKDLSGKNASHDKVYLLELGAGHGRLCYHFLKHLEQLISGCQRQLPSFCYVLSDNVSDNILFWKSHSRLQPYIDKGWVDFAHVDVTSFTSLSLEISGIRIEPGSLTQPLLVMGNYLFDSIPHDLFYIKEGKISEVFVTTLVDKEFKGDSKENILANMSLQYEVGNYVEMPYREKYLDQLIRFYAKLLPDQILHFPNTGLKCIEQLRSFAPQGLLLLMADKGYYYEEELKLFPPPQPIIHKGCFSLSVNFHAYKQYCNDQGGQMLFPKSLASSINIACLFFLPNVQAYSETMQAYNRFVEDFSPDEYYVLRIKLMDTIATMNFVQISAMIKMSHYDSTLFVELYPRILELIRDPGISNLEKWNLFQIIIKVWDMYYPLGEETNLPFLLAELLFHLNYYQEAIKFLDLSDKLYGERVSTSCNYALCYMHLKQFDKAAFKINEILRKEEHNQVALSLQSDLEKMREVHSAC